MDIASSLVSRASDAAKSYTDLAALNDVKKLGRNQDPQAILEVARQFESFFISQLMKEMRSGVDLIGKDNYTNSNEMKFHQQMFDQQLSMEVSSKGGYGLAEMLARQLTQQFDLNWGEPEESVEPASLQRKSTPVPNMMPAVPASLSKVNIVDDAPDESLLDLIKEKLSPLQDIISSNESKEAEGIPINKENFFSVLKDLATNAAKQLGVDKSVLLAQAALETGWGEFVSKDANGSSNNLFNIKSSSGWQGDSVKVTTIEYNDGIAQKEQANFKSYQSYEDSFNDYVNLITNSPRYEKALSCAPDSEAYLTELQRAGYATDPDYAQKILQLLKQPEFDKSALK